MFVCLECGNIFQDLAHWEERHGLDTPPYEEWNGCPYCGGDYTETYRCDCCGEWITNDYIIVENGKRYCENCFCKMELGDE